MSLGNVGFLDHHIGKLLGCSEATKPQLPRKNIHPKNAFQHVSSSRPKVRRLWFTSMTSAKVCLIFGSQNGILNNITFSTNQDFGSKTKPHLWHPRLRRPAAPQLKAAALGGGAPLCVVSQVLWRMEENRWIHWEHQPMINKAVNIIPRVGVYTVFN